MARRRARENPIKTRNKIAIAGGAAAILGLGIFLLTRSSNGATSDQGGQGAPSGGGPQGSNPPNGGGGGVVLKAVQDSHAMAPNPSPPPLDQNGNYATRT